MKYTTQCIEGSKGSHANWLRHPKSMSWVITKPRRRGVRVSPGQPISLGVETGILIKSETATLSPLQNCPGVCTYNVIGEHEKANASKGSDNSKVVPYSIACRNQSLDDESSASMGANICPLPISTQLGIPAARTHARTVQTSESLDAALLAACSLRRPRLPRTRRVDPSRQERSSSAA